MTFCRIMSIWYQTGTCIIFWFPLMCSGRAFGKLPVVTKKIFEIIVAPFCWSSCPCAFQTTCNSIACITTAVSIFPTKALFFNTGSCWLCSNVFSGVGSAMGFTKSVPTGNKCYGFFIIHSHAAKSFTNITGRSQRVWVAVGPFRIYINQSHLNRSQWILQVTVAGITLVSA